MLTAVIPPQNQDILDMVLDGKDLCALRVPTSNGESSLEIMEFDELVRAQCATLNYETPGGRSCTAAHE